MEDPVIQVGLIRLVVIMSFPTFVLLMGLPGQFENLPMFCYSVVPEHQPTVEVADGIQSILMGVVMAKGVAIPYCGVMNSHKSPRANDLVGIPFSKAP